MDLPWVRFETYIHIFESLGLPGRFWGVFAAITIVFWFASLEGWNGKA